MLSSEIKLREYKQLNIHINEINIVIIESLSTKRNSKPDGRDLFNDSQSGCKVSVSGRHTQRLP